MKTIYTSIKYLLAFLPLIAVAQGPTASLTVGDMPPNAEAVYNSTIKAETPPAALFAVPPVNEPISTSDFNKNILTAIAGSENDFAEIKGQPYYNKQDTFTTTNCLPGSTDCYLVMGAKKYYYAEFGSFRSSLRASERSDELKKNILASMGETGWNNTVLNKTGYVEEYKIWSKTSSIKFTCIRTHVEKVGDRYKVYLTIEEI